jgi:hypothetical protein
VSDNITAAFVSRVGDKSCRDFYVPNNFVGPQTDILHKSPVRNSSRFKEHKKTNCPASKSVTDEKTKKIVDTDRSIQGLEHVLFSEEFQLSFQLMEAK